MILFKVKVRLDKTMEDGTTKKVNEEYLLKGTITFGDSENSCIKELEPFISGGYEVKDIKKVQYSDVVETAEDKADKYYCVGFAIVTLDEKSQKEKHTAAKTLVQAADLTDALDRYKDFMKGTMQDFKITSVSETSILDIFTVAEESK